MEKRFLIDTYTQFKLKKYIELICQFGKNYLPSKDPADLLSLLGVKERNKDLDGCLRRGTFEFQS